MYPNIKNTIGGLDNWIELRKDICLNEMIFNHVGGKPKRHINNLMSLFRYFALNHHKRSTLKTLKVYCFALGS